MAKQNTIDSLDIIISANTSSATQNIERLTKKLGTLRNTFKTLNNLHGGIRPLVKGLQDIARIDFSGAEKSLASLAEITKNLEKLSSFKGQPKGLQGKVLSLQNSLQTEEPKWGMQPSLYKKPNIKDFSDFKDFNFKASKELAQNFAVAYKEAEKLQSPLVKLNELLMDANFTGEQIEKVDLAFKSMRPEYTAEQIKKLDNALKEMGLSSRQINRIKKQAGATPDEERRSGGGINGFVKRIGGRLVFSIVRLIVQAVKDLIKELVGVFAQIDEQFNSIFSETYSSVKYLKRAIESSFQPVIQILSPIITMLANAFGDLLNEVSKWSAYISGQDYYWEAQKSVEDFADSVKKSQATFGFDQLNILSQENDDSQNFVKVKLDDTTTSLKSIVDILTSLRPLLDIILDTSFILPLKVIAFVLKIIEPALTIIASVIESLMALLDAVYKTIKKVFSGDNQGIVNVWKDFGNKFVGFWQKFYNNVIVKVGDFFKNIATKITNFLVDVVRKLIEFFSSFGKKVQEATKTAFGGSNPLDKNNNSTASHILKGILGITTGGLSFIFTGFANGGFPEDGLFMANHNEMVGKFSNGKTAVANNEQITQGIYQAVLQAMRESGGNNISVQLDGQEVAKIITKRQNNFGQDLVIGGNINYGKRL